MDSEDTITITIQRLRVSQQFQDVLPFVDIQGRMNWGGRSMYANRGLTVPDDPQSIRLAVTAMVDHLMGRR